MGFKHNLYSEIKHLYKTLFCKMVCPIIAVSINVSIWICSELNWAEFKICMNRKPGFIVLLRFTSQSLPGSY